MRVKLGITKWLYCGLLVALLSVSAPVLADVFKTIDFEVAEGYAAPDSDPCMQNIKDGGDFLDTSYGPVGGAQMYTWGGGSYGVPSGSAAFYYDAAWNWSYARTQYTPFVVPEAQRSDRYLTIEYEALVVFAVPGVASQHIPPRIELEVNSTTTNEINIYHSKTGGEADNLLHLNVDGTMYDSVTNYTYQQWVTEKVVYDQTLDVVTYYYDGAEIGSYALAGDITSFDNVGMGVIMVNRSGAIAVDNIRFGIWNDLEACGVAGTQYLAGDITGAVGVPDCYVDMIDFALLAAQWMQCSDPASPECDTYWK